MKMLRNILIWCVLAALLPCVISAPLQLSSGGDQKFGEWLQNRLKREICVPKRSLEDSAELLSQQENIEPPVTQNSSQRPQRVKRGCNLLTCSVHDLAFRVNLVNNGKNKVPPHKLSPCGYGRRRRRSPHQRSIAPAHREGLLELPKLQARDEAHFKN